AAGIKNSGKPDVAVVINDGPAAAAAAVFTSNRFKAAPVRWSQQAVADGKVRAGVLNSGGANARNGAAGYGGTAPTAGHLAQLLSVPAQEIAVCSTGLIGDRLPMQQLLVGVDAATVAACTTGGPSAAEAIMTTDTVAKNTERQGTGYRI